MTPFVFPLGDPLRKAAESFVARLRRGERPTLAEYTERFPDQAMRIREIFPRLLAAERRVNDDQATGPFGPVQELPHAPKTIGEYLIVREIGRGGMGIVYEAVQESLGRQVALKVLPSGPFSRGAFLERFRREARAAARLHHTNIVPVYGVGEAGGVHYYAMQYIEGMGLDVALKEFRQRRGMAPVVSTGGTKTVNIKKKKRKGGEPLNADDFELGPASILPSPEDNSEANSPATETNKTLQELAEATGPKYYRSISRLGVQAAEAIAYAHMQGVLHRDIKPSNFLLDRYGILWITDFGLAKAEGENMTGTGDIVGTLRYMAPERFDGVSDARSDVYALGMTLYELIALKPAFEEDDRVKLVKRIASERPKRLRQVDPDVPRDLETIIFKAIERDPLERYGSAADVADDLRRFLTDRPIMARRATAWEELRRWCRRNQLVTGLIGLIAILWTLLIVVVAFANFQLRRERDEVVNLIKRRESEQRLSDDRLWNSQVTLAELRRSERKPGQRFDALSALDEARRIRVDRTLINQAVASLALPDARRRHTWNGWPIGSIALDFDSKFARYVRSDRQGAISIRTVFGDEETSRLPASGGPVLPRFSRTDAYLGLWHEPDGQWRIWQLNADPMVTHQVEKSNVTCFDFSFDDQFCATGRMDKRINVWRLPDVELLNAIELDQLPNCISFHPFRTELAVAMGREVAFIDIITGQEKARSPVPAAVRQIAWHPDGRHFAVATAEGAIHLFDRPGQPAYQSVSAHRGGAARITFHPEGQVFASSGPDDVFRLWDAVSGRQLLNMPCRMPMPRFSSDGQQLAAEIDGQRLAIFNFEPGREYRTLVRRKSPAQCEYRDGSISPDGQWLAMAANDGVSLWNLHSGEEMARLAVGESTACLFVSDRELLTAGELGVYSWSFMPGPDQRRWEIGPPRQIVAGRVDHIAQNRNGSRIAAAAKVQGAMVLDPRRPTIRNTLLAHEAANYVSVHPDGTDLATGTRDGGKVRIWDARTSRLVKDIDIHGGSDVVYSPDGRWLAVNPEAGGVQLWDALRYQPGPKLAAAKQSRMAFFPGGQFVVVDSGQGSLRIYASEPRRNRTPTAPQHEECELILQLEDPHRDRASWIAVSPEGGRIVFASNDTQSIHVWNLSAISKGLARLFPGHKLPDFGQMSLANPIESVHVVGESLLEPSAQARWSIAANSMKLAAHPTDADAYCRRGNAWNELGVSDRALDDFARALALDANHAEALFLRGMELYRRREWEAALADFVRVRDAGERTALADLARMMHGKALLQLDRVEDMMIEIDRLLLHYPQDPQLYYQRALGHVYRDRYGAAVADLHLALKHGSTNDQALNNLAWILVAGPPEWRDLERGLGFAQRAVTIAPHKGTYQNTLGVAYYRLNKYPEAVAAFEKSLAAGKGQFDGYDLYFEALCFAHMNELARAQECFDRAERWQKTTRLNVHELAELEQFRREAADALTQRRSNANGP